MNHLLKKYNQSAPRYTSYPPVPFWTGAPSQKDWIEHIKAEYTDKGVDLYVHVPFCEKLCYYCGCNRTITKNHSIEEEYLELLFKEWNLYTAQLGFEPIVNTLHFGGGTPTFLSAKNLELVIKTLTSHKSLEFIGSIEIDPRTLKDEHLEVFRDNQIQRVSIGIQDFDSHVQKAINREQSFDLVEEVVKKLREHNVSSINFDVIYGLPKQTLDSIANTFKLIKKLKPDLIAYYSYAHLPDRVKNQKLINEADLPKAQEKQALYEMGKKILSDGGFIEVGMDHFGLEHSYLVKAKNTKTLHRNFMGYLDQKSNILIGLGPTSISDSGRSFVQNEKSFGLYSERINKAELPLTTGHVMSSEDKVIKKNILDLMCNNETLLNSDQIPFYEEVEKELDLMEKDELLIREGSLLKVTNLGKIFIRNIAMSLDFHLRNKKNEIKFSQSI